MKVTFWSLWLAGMVANVASLGVQGWRFDLSRFFPESPVALVLDLVSAALLITAWALAVAQLVANRGARRPAREAHRQRMAARRAYLEAFDRGRL